MNGHAVDPRPGWREKAGLLDRQGYFRLYSRERRAEVLKKGYVGRWAPDRAIGIAREQVDMRIAVWTPQIWDNLRDGFGLAGPEARQAFCAVLDEVRAEYYIPPRELKDPPGIPFIYGSRRLQCQLYLKIQVEGPVTKPRVLVWSCHRAIYSEGAV